MAKYLGREMIYEYSCSNCEIILEIRKRISLCDEAEHCQTCGKLLTKLISLTHSYGAKPDEPKFNAAFGKVLTYSQAKKEAKARGMIEVGNEDVKKHLKGPRRQDYTV